MHVARLGRFLENPKIDDRKSRKSRFLSKYFILALHLQTEDLAQTSVRSYQVRTHSKSWRSKTWTIFSWSMDQSLCETGKISGKLGKCQLKF